MSDIYDDGTMERKIVAAITKVAGKHKEGLDTEALDEALAQALTEAGVTPEFAYVAACAANKAMSVDYLKGHDDSTRADAFALFNPEHVVELMGGGTAIVEDEPEDGEDMDDIVIEVTKAAALKKTASAKAQEPVELQYTLGEVLNKMAHALDKVGIALDSCYRDLLTKEASYHDTIRKLHGTAMTNSDKGTAVSVLGKYASKALKDSGHTMDNVQVPAVCVMTGTVGSDLVKKASEQLYDYEQVNETLKYAVSKAASLRDTYERLNTHYKDMRKHSDIWEQPLRKVAEMGVGERLVDLTLGAPTGFAIGAVDSALSAGDSLADTAKNYLQWKSSITDSRKGEVLDAELLKDDRELDRLLAWSDMMSDPRLKGYPSEDVHVAVNKLMDTDRSLESASNRELLRQNLRRAMVQGGELSTADTAALSTMLKARSDARKPRADEKIQGDIKAKGGEGVLGSQGGSLQGLSKSVDILGRKLVGVIPEGVRMYGSTEKFWQDRADNKARREEAQNVREEAQNVREENKKERAHRAVLRGYEVTKGKQEEAHRKAMFDTAEKQRLQDLSQSKLKSDADIAKVKADEAVQRAYERLQRTNTLKAIRDARAAEQFRDLQENRARYEGHRADMMSDAFTTLNKFRENGQWRDYNSLIAALSGYRGGRGPKPTP